MILDSTFLVDFEREVRRKTQGPAIRFLQARPNDTLAITFTIAGELAAGATLGGNRTQWEEFIRPYRFLGYHADVGWNFGILFRQLKQKGRLIGANDLWIAATALAYSEPIVTRNAAEFSRVHGLDVLSY